MDFRFGVVVAVSLSTMMRLVQPFNRPLELISGVSMQQVRHAHVFALEGKQHSHRALAAVVCPGCVSPKPHSEPATCMVVFGLIHYKTANIKPWGTLANWLAHPESAPHSLQ